MGRCDLSRLRDHIPAVADTAAHRPVQGLPPTQAERAGQEKTVSETYTVEISSNDSVIIEKMFGPHIFTNLRITADTTRGCWVIERQWASTSKYIEWITIPDQIDAEFEDVE